MLHVLGCLTEDHDLGLVALACLLCLFACWTAMNLLMRARLAADQVRNAWILAAGVVFGAGIWTTHFVGMLAFRSAVPLGFDLPLTVASVVLAIVLSTFAFSTLGFAQALRPKSALLSGTIGGLAISAVHYTGMNGLQGAFRLQWDGAYVAASIIIGVVFVISGALAALTIRNIRGRMLGALFWTLAICGVHFVGMSAVTIIPDPTIPYNSGLVAPNEMAVAVAAVALLVMGLGLVAAQIDNHLAYRRKGDADRLHAHIAVLEATQHNLEATTRDLNQALVAASAANVAKTTFLTAMSHELRTPLNAILGFSDILQSETFGPLGSARYRDYAGDIHKSGVHLLELINEILDLTRLQAGQIELQETVFSLRDVVGEALQTVSELAVAGRLRLIDECPASLPAVRAGRRRIYQVVLNLLSNAIKFTPPGGTVIARAGVGAAGLYVQITDTGIGIAEEDMPKVLERFGQVDSSIARRYEGAGLGIPISMELMKVHGGTLEIQSVVGKGTTITITLPSSRIVALEHAA